MNNLIGSLTLGKTVKKNQISTETVEIPVNSVPWLGFNLGWGSWKRARVIQNPEFFLKAPYSNQIHLIYKREKKHLGEMSSFPLSTFVRVLLPSYSSVQCHVLIYHLGFIGNIQPTLQNDNILWPQLKSKTYR